MYRNYVNYNVFSKFGDRILPFRWYNTVWRQAGTASARMASERHLGPTLPISTSSLLLLRADATELLP
jgi:hypothetical protein